MPVEFTLEMYAEREVELPFFIGHIARGVLLHMLKHADPSLSAQPRVCELFDSCDEHKEELEIRA